MAVRRSLVFVLAPSLLACWGLATAARAQQCRNGSNPSLRAAIVGGDRQAVDSSMVTGIRRATSYLCGYEPWKGWSPDSSDAWCEAAAGVGVGEMLAYESFLAPDGSLVPLEIWTGYGKSPALFRANGRPRRVRVWALGIEKWINDCGDEPCAPDQYLNPQVMGSIEVELHDVNGWQPLPIPQHGVTLQDSSNTPVTVLGIEIVSVYPGARYTDTCITGIRRQGSTRAF